MDSLPVHYRNATRFAPSVAGIVCLKPMLFIEKSSVKLQHLYSWEENWNGQSNTLLLGNDGEFYLANTTLHAPAPRNAKKVSLKEALEWYAETSKYGDSGTGDIRILTKAASEQLAA